MASTPQDTRKLSVNRTRPTAAAVQAASAQTGSPHTPLNRSISSHFNSPSGGFRTDDENNLVFEVGARVLRAGFGGESRPRCHLYYSPDQLRRVGDYRHLSPSYERKGKQSDAKDQTWGREGYELWHLDVREQDLSFISDRLERLIREVEQSYLMLDSRPRRVSLVVSPDLPRPLLELVMSNLFTILQPPSITLLPNNIMAVVASGLRTGLVIDIGWSETSVSAVYEYREVTTQRTTRAAKALAEEFAQLAPGVASITVEEAEDLAFRLGWCRQRDLESVALQNEEDTIASIGSHEFEVSVNDTSAPVDRVFFESPLRKQNALDRLDDHDWPIDLLAYSVLLTLPMDVRKTCMSRIVIVGGCSKIPGLKRRLLQEIELLITQRGWDTIKTRGSTENTTPPSKDFVSVKPSSHKAAASIKFTENTTSAPEDVASYIPAHLTPQEHDPVMAKIRQQQLKLGNEKEPVEGVIRGVESLGSWAGASLMANLRIRGLVEVEKEKFITSGLVGGATRREVSVTAQRQSMGPTSRPGPAERSSWTLGAFA